MAGRVRHVRVLMGLLLTAALLLCSRAATADGGRGRVLLLTNQDPAAAWPEAEKRTSAELGALGFEVVSVAVSGAPTPHDVEGLLREIGARVGVGVRHPGDADGVTSPPIVAYALEGPADALAVRPIASERVQPTSSPEEVGLLAAELVYSALAQAQPVAPAATPPAPPPPAAVIVPRATEPRRVPDRFEVRAGPWYGAMPRGVGPLAGVAAGASIWPLLQAGLDLQVNLPLVPARLQGEEGRATVWIGDERLHVVARTPPWQRLGVMAGLGVGGLHSVSNGRPRTPLQGGTDAASAVLLSSMLAGGARVAPRLRLLLAGRAALAAPEITVEFAGRQVAALGRPFLDLSLNLTSGFPGTATGESRARP